MQFNIKMFESSRISILSKELVIKDMRSIKKLASLAAKRIIESNALLFTAGAGIGVDSGLPTFRDNEVILYH